MNSKPYYSTITHCFYPTLELAVSDSRSAASNFHGEDVDFDILFRDIDGEDNIMSHIASLGA